MKEETIIVSQSSSKCGNCGFDCDPDEKSHESILGYSEQLRKLRGCGVTWKYITSSYYGIDDVAKHMNREDLINVDYFSFTPTSSNN